ncbi:hypothetical protein K2X14_13995 [Acetobacter sp. TBRC 12305]|uniref:Transposase n=1 Tax=Acetobacter garciniae TaxID=2817435 RepID=A0A939KRF0_9PROT|nr:hypothetical protein [Acetobacter garciniae]MBO1326757.1 hypothetical protein [Acetobacter garciniae]MBX0345945.1 hypothetical protein [Acetobacter garciniae]
MVEKKKTSRYSTESRERAVHLLDKHRSDYPSLSAAWQEIGGKPGCSGDSLHDWWKQTRRDAGAQPGSTTAETAPTQRIAKRYLNSSWNTQAIPKISPGNILYNQHPLVSLGSVDKRW